MNVICDLTPAEIEGKKCDYEHHKEDDANDSEEWEIPEKRILTMKNILKFNNYINYIQLRTTIYSYI